MSRSLVAARAALTAHRMGWRRLAGRAGFYLAVGMGCLAALAHTAAWGEDRAAPKKAAPPAAGCATGACPRGETYNTQIPWIASLDEAAKQAERQKKLLLVMHISGNFARSEFT